jgi:protein-disulfide isomerase
MEPQPDWRRYADVGRWIGPPDATVILVEFSDFQCPWCKRLLTELRQVRHRYPNDFAILYRHLPLTSLHPHAKAAAVAAECAGRLGHFEGMHDILFESSDSLGVVPWHSLARRAGVADADSGEFNACLVDPAAIAVVERDSTAAAALGQGTPMSLIEGVRIRGSVPATVLDSIVKAAIQRSEK